MLFVVATSLTDPVQVRRHADDELARLRTLREAGVLRSFPLRADGGGAFLLLDAPDRGEAEAHLSSRHSSGPGS